MKYSSKEVDECADCIMHRACCAEYESDSAPFLMYNGDMINTERVGSNEIRAPLENPTVVSALDHRPSNCLKYVENA